MASACITPREFRLYESYGADSSYGQDDGLLSRYSAFKEEFLAFERDYKGWPTIKWTQQHSHIPIMIGAGYLTFVYFGQKFMEKRPLMRLKPLFAAWNLLLSLFSILGASRLVPTLLSGLMNEGLQHTICSDAKQWIMDGPTGLWLTLFIFSKIPELIDTAFLVVRKKPVIFLHWYHHFTVMLYCWHALHTLAAPGIWFATMNFIVHSIMYAYYFATNVGLYKYVSPVASTITTLQILQMVGGTLILSRCAYTFLSDGSSACHINQTNLLMGLGMYLSYFALFAIFFIGKYCGSGSRQLDGDSSKKVTQQDASTIAACSKKLMMNSAADPRVRLTQKP